MLRSLSALVISILIVLSGAAVGQCPEATIGVYFDIEGSLSYVTPIQHQPLVMYVVWFGEAPIGGAAWKLEMTSPHYSGQLVGPPGPNCQPPWCPYQDPPFWHIGTTCVGPVVLGDPFDGGVRQGLGSCFSGFFGNPVLLATVTLLPWADILGSIEVDVTAVAEEYEGLVYALCDGRICDTVTGVTSHIGTTVVGSDGLSWGSVKALYR
jgi:hypothetical protein